MYISHIVISGYLSYFPHFNLKLFISKSIYNTLDQLITIRTECSLENSYFYINLQLNYLPRGYKVLRPDGDEIDTFLEGGEIELVGGPFHSFGVK